MILMFVTANTKALMYKQARFLLPVMFCVVVLLSLMAYSTLPVFHTGFGAAVVLLGLIGARGIEFFERRKMCV